MGTYNLSAKEILGKLAETLDNLEGDISKANLIVSLEMCKDYPYTVEGESDLMKERWNKIVNTE